MTSDDLDKDAVQYILENPIVMIRIYWNEFVKGDLYSLVELVTFVCDVIKCRVKRFFKV